MRISRKRFLEISGLYIAAAAGERILGGTGESSAKSGSSKPVRWAMAVDLVRCAQNQGCTQCIDACHRAHNVPDFPTPERRIEWIRKAEYERAFPEHDSRYQLARIKKSPVPLLCNHCENPPCVRVCPTQATWKREDGVVMMDSHRCIGCRYCMAACPYGSRSFNWSNPRAHIAELNSNFPARTQGVVEKCNFCEERIGEGAPFCVESCPQGALVFGDLNDPDSALRSLLATRFAIRRKPELGSNPRIYYLV